jgi:ubiquilin
MAVSPEGASAVPSAVPAPPLQPPPAAPATAPRPPELYAAQLSLMAEMGFADADANLRALVESGGNLDAAIQKLMDQGLA